MESIEKALTSLGLSEKESKTYLGLLKLGRATATTLTLKLSMKKPTVYLMLEQLRQKGLVLKIPKSNKVFYEAKSPQELHSIISEKLAEVKRLIPKLEELYPISEATSIRFYEGIRGIKDAYTYTVKTKEDLYCFYGVASYLSAELVEIVDEYNKKNAKNNIKTLALAPAHHSLNVHRAKDVLYKREVKILPVNAYSSAVSVDITSSFVRIVIYKSEQAIVIEDDQVAKAFRQIFKLVWGLF